MCTLEKRGNVYLLTLTGTGEHRLNPALLTSIRSAFAQIQSDPLSLNSALVTTAAGKYFSNGLDLFSAGAPPPLLSSLLQHTIADVLSLPIPTVAAVSGHAAAAGFALALAQDHIVMRSDRGFLYISEIDIGVPMRKYFVELVRSKIWDARVLRDVVLRGVRITGKVGLEMGIVDRAVRGEEETVERR